MIYLAEIEWVAGGDENYYQRRGMTLDRRNLPDQGAPGLTVGRFVVCEGAVVPAGAVALGELGHVLTPGERAGLSGVVGEAVPALTVEQAVERMAVNWTDVTGQTR